MHSDTRIAIHRSWPGILLFAALFPTLFITQAAYAELAISLLSLGLLWGTVVPHLRGRPLHLLPGPTISLGAFVCVLTVRALLTKNPMIAFGGAWTSDGTVFAIASMAVTLVCTAAWAISRQRNTGIEGYTPILVGITLIATASSIAAWQWGSTDPSGGPASGFTANSQLQLQLLTAGLTAALAWAALHRRDVAHVACAVACAGMIFVGMLECRSSVMLPSLGLGAMCALAVATLSGRLSPTRIAVVSTGLLATAYAGLTVFLLSPSTSPRLTALLNSLGNGRGTLWASALHRILLDPVFGRGAGQSASLSGWRIDGGTLSYVSTSDPHSLALTVAAAGGSVAIGLLLVVVYFVQRDLIAGVAASDERRSFALLIVGGSVMLFALGQFTFVFAFAWVLMAVLVGLVLGSAPNPIPVKDRPSSRALTGATLAIATLLIALVWVPTQGRAASTRVLLTNLSSPPHVMVDRQLKVIDAPWDLMPAEFAAMYLKAATAERSERSDALRARFNETMQRVAVASTTDTRMIAARLRVWAGDAERGDPNPAELDRIIADGITSDPGLGLWATAGLVYSLAEDDEMSASRYAGMLAERPDWRDQALLNTDPATRSRILTAVESAQREVR